MNEIKEELTSREVKSKVSDTECKITQIPEDVKYKTIICQCKNCNKKIKIPETWDDDYEKNDFFILLSGNETSNGAFAHPDLGVFACDECFEKFVAWNWGPPDYDKRRCSECDSTNLVEEVCGNNFQQRKHEKWASGKNNDA